MNTDKEILLQILDEIKIIIENNANADGALKMDMLKARLALEFAKTSVEEAIKWEFGWNTLTIRSLYAIINI